jgi:CHASE3 domain sensor protein
MRKPASAAICCRATRMFLEPYHGARARIDSVLHEVDSLIEDSPRQQQNLSSLRFMIDQRFDCWTKAYKIRTLAQVICGHGPWQILDGSHS